VRDMCEVSPAYEVDKDELFEAWKTWCVDEGRDRSGTKAVFARDLSAIVPGLTSARPRDGEERTHVWRGLKLKQQSVRPLTTPDQKTAGQGSAEGRVPLNHAAGQGWSGVDPIVDPSCAACGSVKRWRARDGRDRCWTCEPPVFPSEVVA
jgi:hypothetical protein